ncbi:MAG: arginase family protein [Bacteroidota bacterium]
MTNQFNLLYPEWQGYASHQEVYHGAKYFCQHMVAALDHEVEVPIQEELAIEEGVIGRSSIIRMLNATTNVLNQADPTNLFMVGGTCGCELAPISFLNQKYDNDLAIFWFDAHGDLNTPDTSPSQRFHGMPLRTLLGEGDPLISESISGILTPSQVALVGARDLDPAESEYVHEHKLPVFTPRNRTHTSELIDFAKSRGFSKAYIHFDLDVLDPVEFPHVLVPVQEGLSLQHAVDALRMISDHLEVVGSSIVEYCPKEGGGLADVSRLVEGMGVAH